MATYNIKIGQKVRLEGLLLDSNGQRVKGTATWASNDTAVATVKGMYTKSMAHPITGEVTNYTASYTSKVQKATVTGVSAGTATITVTSNGQTATATVVVSAGTTVASVSM